MKRFGLGRRGPDHTEPTVRRLELMQQDLTPGQLDTLVVAATERLVADESLDPAVTGMAAKYLTMLEARIEEEDGGTGEGRPLKVGMMFRLAGVDLRQEHGSAAKLDFVDDPQGIVDGTNADEGRYLAEMALTDAYYHQHRAQD